jgi:hypothetical protein
VANLFVTVHSPCRFEPLTLTLGFGILRRSTSSIHGVVSLGERGFKEGGLNGYTYFGLIQQEEFHQQLVSLVPNQQREIEFLIGRNADPDTESYGRSRNLGLLLSAG